MQLFIRLISTDIHNNEVALTANEFNSLRILFKIKPISLHSKTIQVYLKSTFVKNHLKIADLGLKKLLDKDSTYYCFSCSHAGIFPNLARKLTFFPVSVSVRYHLYSD